MRRSPNERRRITIRSGSRPCDVEQPTGREADRSRFRTSAKLNRRVSDSARRADDGSACRCGLWWQSFGAAHQDTAILLQFVAATLAAAPATAKMVLSFRTNLADAFTDQLVTLAVLGALVGGEYIAAVLVPVIMDIGHFLEQRGIQGTQAAIDGLRRLTSGSAIVLEAGVQKMVPVRDVQEGSTRCWCVLAICLRPTA